MIGIMQDVLITYYMSSEEGNVMPYWIYQKKNHIEKSMEGWVWILAVGGGDSGHFYQMKYYQKYRGKDKKTFGREWQIV